MTHLFFTPEGLKITLTSIVVLLECIILGNTIAGEPGKENNYSFSNLLQLIG